MIVAADPGNEASGSEAPVAGQRRYVAYRAQKDRARGMLSRFHDKEWTRAYIHGVLFDL
jgi:phycoerythrobilin:ferredoxin oxidoreductase